jgi:cytochrome P450
MWCLTRTTQSNGADWQRHRKLTAPCFNERASSTVWAEALQQSNTLLTHWLASPNDTISSIVQDTSTIALNVISAVAFENHQVNTPDQGHTLSLREAIVTVMSTSMSPVLEHVVPWLITSRLAMLLPSHIAKLLLAMREFRAYMDETIARERAKPTSTQAKPNLISTLLNAHDPDPEANDTQPRLSASELRGNMFIFTVGGLETTAITLSYALALLATHPEVQDWVAEEALATSTESHEYAKVFPKLARTMAVMVRSFQTIPFSLTRR